MLLSLGTWGCGADSPAAAGVGGQGGAGGTGGSALPATLSFDASTALLLKPGETRTATVIATPPQRYQVRLALQGDFRDGSLSKSEVFTADDGRASFDVLAPSASTAFSVRASVGDEVFSKLGVSVSADGFATLKVDPSYGGKRPVSSWVASVRTGTTCGELLGNPPEDGDLVGSASMDQSPVISFVPVGPALAVTLRAGKYLSGCKDVADLVAGEETEVTVAVTDVPVKVDETDLFVSLTLGEPNTPWTKLFATTLTAVQDTVVLNSKDDVEALISVMQTSLQPADAKAFSTLRSSEAWDDAVRAKLGANAGKALRSRLSSWMNEGVKGLSGGIISGRLVSAGPSASGQAFVELQSVAGMPATVAGMPDQALASWSADPGDTVLLGTSLFVLPSRLTGAVALSAAQASVPGAKSVDVALASALPCTDVAQVIAETGKDPVFAHAGCDALCVRSLCESAVSTIWTTARDASASTVPEIGSLVISATGTALVDDNARPASFNGNWVGNFNVGETTTSVGGPITGSKPLPPR